jgi:hypothetical protein
MNKGRLLQILFAGLLVLAFQGCKTYPNSGPSALVGTWTNRLGTVWTVRADGTFDVDLNKDGEIDGWGKYAVEGNTMTVWRTGGINPKGCAGKGIYKFTRTEDTLQFTVVEDACKLRKKNALFAWRRK